MPLTPVPVEPLSPLAPSVPSLPLMHTGSLYSMSPDCMVVLVRVQMYFPDTHCGAVVCHPPCGSVTRDGLWAYSTSTDAMTASATAMSLPSSLAPGPRWTSLASRFQ